MDEKSSTWMNFLKIKINKTNLRHVQIRPTPFYPLGALFEPHKLVKPSQVWLMPWVSLSLATMVGKLAWLVISVVATSEL
jgi:hypothetical protein